MKKIGLAALGIVVTLVVLVNGVSAENMGVFPIHQNIPYAENFATYTVRIYDISQISEHTINATIKVWGSGADTDLLFKFENSTASSGWLGSGDDWNWGTPTGSEETIKMYVKAKLTAPQNNNYRFIIQDLSGASESAGATVAGSSIPEFPTIAIPTSIALLFVVFYWRKRGGNNRK